MGLYEILSVGAAILSAIALTGAWWVACRQKDLDTRMLAIEEARESDRQTQQASADLDAELVSPSGKGRREFRVSNEGQAEAQNIRVEVARKRSDDGPRNIEDQEYFMEGPDQYPFKLDPGTVEVWQIPRIDGWSGPFQVVLYWDDDAKEGRSKDTTIP